MVQATNDPWSCAVTAPMARDLKLWFAFVRPSAATIPSSSADTVVLLWVMFYIRLSLLSLWCHLIAIEHTYQNMIGMQTVLSWVITKPTLRTNNTETVF